MSIVEFENDSTEIIFVEQEYWIKVNDAARIIGYKNPVSNASLVISRNADEFEGLIKGFQIENSSTNQESRYFCEEGFYIFCMLARTKKAKQFRRIVSKKIKELRQEQQQVIITPQFKNMTITDVKQNLVQMMQNMFVVSDTVSELIEDVTEIKEKVESLQDLQDQNFPLTPGQRRIIREKVQSWAKKLVDRTPGLSFPPAVASCWAQFKGHFDVEQYQDLPTRMFTSAIVWLDRKMSMAGNLNNYLQKEVGL